MVKVLTTADPSFGQVSRQMNKILEQLQKGYSNFYPSDTWNPAVNLYETDEAYHVCVDLSGVEKDKIDLTIVGQRLILKGSSGSGLSGNANDLGRRRESWQQATSRACHGNRPWELQP